MSDISLEVLLEKILNLTVAINKLTEKVEEKSERQDQELETVRIEVNGLKTGTAIIKWMASGVFTGCFMLISWQINNFNIANDKQDEEIAKIQQHNVEQDASIAKNSYLLEEIKINIEKGKENVTTRN